MAVLLSLPVALKHRVNVRFRWKSKRGLAHRVHGLKQVNEVSCRSLFEDSKGWNGRDVVALRFDQGASVVEKYDGGVEFKRKSKASHSPGPIFFCGVKVERSACRTSTQFG